MTCTIGQTWQDEVRDAMRISYDDAERTRLVAERDTLIRCSCMAQVYVASLGEKNSAEYRKAFYGARSLRRQLNRAHDACDTLPDGNQALEKRQYRIVNAIEWYMSGVYIYNWTDQDFVLQCDLANGDLHVFFGGVDQPIGPDHGHIVLQFDGWVVYRRDPGEPHGSQNWRRTPMSLLISA